MVVEEEEEREGGRRRRISQKAVKPASSCGCCPCPSVRTGATTEASTPEELVTDANGETAVESDVWPIDSTAVESKNLHTV